VIDYIKYYETAAVLPQFNSGALSEAALWSGNMTAILAALYNSGTRVSAKEYCGVKENFVRWVKQNVKQEAIVAQPTTASTTPVIATDMELFIYGTDFEVDGHSTFLHSAANGYAQMGLSVDGAMAWQGSTATGERDFYYNLKATANYPSYLLSKKKIQKLFGLHKIEMKTWTDQATLSMISRTRKLNISEVE
jgi:hypothetical protein